MEHATHQHVPEQLQPLLKGAWLVRQHSMPLFNIIQCCTLCSTTVAYDCHEDSSGFHQGMLMSATL